jgi:hypothetical protein
MFIFESLAVKTVCNERMIFSFFPLLRNEKGAGQAFGMEIVLSHAVTVQCFVLFKTGLFFATD